MSGFESNVVCYVCLQPDTTSELEEKAKFLSTFKESEELEAAIKESGANDPSSLKEEMDKSIGEAIEQELPHIESLYNAKARAIIAEARTKTAKYLEAHRALNKLSIKRKLFNNAVVLAIRRITVV